MRATEQEYPILDSTFFIAFEMTHRAFKTGLANASSLNITQYRVLVKLLNAQPDGLSQSDLGMQLNLKANVITHAVNILEKARFALRARNADSDGRIRMTHITETGIKQIAQVNESIIKQLYALFPTEDAFYRDILEASIAAGAHIDTPCSNDPSEEYAASRALVSLELVKAAVEEALQNTCGASLNECRILQRLGELGEPQRIGDLARQLQMTPVTVARAVNKLCERSWVTRLSSPYDQKAVFVSETSQGKCRQRAIARTVALLARKRLWNNLNQEQQDTLARAWNTVIAEVRTREEAERKAALSFLYPLKHLSN